MRKLEKTLAQILHNIMLARLLQKNYMQTSVNKSRHVRVNIAAI